MTEEANSSMWIAAAADVVVVVLFEHIQGPLQKAKILPPRYSSSAAIFSVCKNSYFVPSYL